MNEYNSLTALSPLDGRYREKVVKLTDYFSEQALIKYRLTTEIKYLLFISQKKIAPAFSSKQKKHLLALITNFNQKEAEKIKTIEQNVRHDVKAVEYYIREKMQALKINGISFIHFGLTSEDTNSIAYGLTLKESLQEIMLPQLKNLISELFQMVKENKSVVMLARTHGQAAVPTTVGKEFINFAMRVSYEVNYLSQLPVEAKLTGAVGTLAAHKVSFPNKDWIELSQEFIRSLELNPNIYTTQILPADSYVKIFQSLQLINTILIGLVQDVWGYISDEYFVQQVIKHEVGSSTMPQKVNPIDFENAEGNLGIANSLFEYFIAKLPISRLQRDLSDSTVKRNIGIALGYSLLAYQNCVAGLQKIKVNNPLLEKELLEHWEIVTEGIQTILRTTGNEKAYEELKKFSRGKKLSEVEIKKFINHLSVSKETKQILLNITPLTYTGLAEKIVEKGLQIYAKK